MGSASAIRPHRRARSAKVVYKDSFSEDEDQDFSISHQPFHTKPSESKDLTRRNLALKRVSRSQERAEVLQIQKAIEESLSQGKANVNTHSLSLDAADGAKEVVDSEEEAPNVPDCTTDEAGFQCPYASPAQEISEIKSQEEVVVQREAIFDEGDVESSGQGIELAEDPRDIKSKEINSADKAVAEKDEDWSCEEEDDDDADDGTEDESSDASRDVKYKRKRPVNLPQKGKKAAGSTAKDRKTFQVKKPRSSRAVPEARAPLPAKKGLPSDGNGLKPSTHSKFADAKGQSHTSTTFETSKKHVMNSKECKDYGRRGVLLKGCKTALREPQKSQNTALFNKASLFDSAPFESSGILGCPAQSPTGLHRRVIGLSRRFKPPPLHPYLPKMEG